ncbi:MAG: hypothetical protein K6E59_03705 [Bacilli bacterium]|nr:hypothetical protein [Bacilli bacterium]
MMVSVLLQNYVTTAGNAALPIAISLIATFAIFVLGRLAFFLVRSGELHITAKRIADLDHSVVRFSLSMGNDKPQEIVLSDLRLCKKQNKRWITVGELGAEPIMRKGPNDFVRAENGIYSLHVPASSTAEAVVEFHLSEFDGPVYLVGTNKKGKTVKARISLSERDDQYLSFH